MNNEHKRAGNCEEHSKGGSITKKHNARDIARG